MDRASVASVASAAFEEAEACLETGVCPVIVVFEAYRAIAVFVAFGREKKVVARVAMFAQVRQAGNSNAASEEVGMPVS